MIALDLFAAIMAADLPNREYIVLVEVLNQCYGPRKAKSVHLDPATIEHYTGLHRNNVRRGVKGLEKAEILFIEPDGSYGFNKDYETWKPGGRPITERLSGGLLRFARSSVSRHGIKTKAKAESASVSIQEDSDAQACVPIQSDSDRSTVSTSDAIQRDSSPKDFLNPTGFKSEGFPQSNGIDPHIEEHARLEKKKEEKREERERALESEIDRVHAKAEMERLDFNNEVQGPGCDSPEAIALEKWATDLGCDRLGESYSFWARKQASYMPIEWIKSILERKVMGRSTAASVRLLTTIAADWRASGKPEWPIGSTSVSTNGYAPRQTAEDKRNTLKAGLLKRFAPPQPDDDPSRNHEETS